MSHVRAQGGGRSASLNQHTVRHLTFKDPHQAEASSGVETCKSAHTGRWSENRWALSSVKTLLRVFSWRSFASIMTVSTTSAGTIETPACAACAGSSWQLQPAARGCAFSPATNPGVRKPRRATHSWSLCCGYVCMYVCVYSRCMYVCMYVCTAGVCVYVQLVYVCMHSWSLCCGCSV